MSFGNNDPPTTPLIIMSDDFYAGYQSGMRDFEVRLERNGGDRSAFNDVTLTQLLIEVTSYCCNKTDLWQAGFYAGFYAAFYCVPSTWIFWEQANTVQFGLRRAS